MNTYLVGNMCDAIPFPLQCTPNIINKAIGYRPTVLSPTNLFDIHQDFIAFLVTYLQFGQLKSYAPYKRDALSIFLILKQSLIGNSFLTDYLCLILIIIDSSIGSFFLICSLAYIRLNKVSEYSSYSYLLMITNEMTFS